MKGILRDAHGSIEPQHVLERIAPGVVSPPMPEGIATWNELTREKLQAGDSQRPKVNTTLTVVSTPTGWLLSR